ncbi:slit homolog 3 protein-like [Clytia hemisphaerica]|uniref:slit homolog 3 protein-like n=1 Tax=Clytia hemisphaerica TaxID=252671 RepID=UPI0034D437AD
MGYQNVKEVNISNNIIMELESGIFSNLPKVQKVFIDNNSIKLLKNGVLDDAMELLWISFNGNGIEKIEKDVFKLHVKLDRLWFNNNNLSELPEGLLKNQHLNRLEMQNNQFTDFPANAFNSQLVKLLNNRLTTLRKEWFLSSPDDLDVEGNPLHCDCTLYNVIQALISDNNKFDIFGNCRSPPHVKDIYDDIQTKNKLNCTTCSVNNCQNNSTCQIINETSYNCSCSDEFEGRFCQYENQCLQSPCGNNGTCLLSNDSFVCSCMNEFGGTRCHLIQLCYSDKPCENSGQCNVHKGTTMNTCTCLFGYLGSRCQINLGFIVLVCLIVFATLIVVCILCFYKPKHSDIYIVEKGHLLSKIGVDNPSFGYSGQSSTSQN